MPDESVSVEEKLTYLERSHADLDQVVRELFDKVTSMERDLKHLRNTFEQSREPQDAPQTLEEERPPHY